MNPQTTTPSFFVGATPDRVRGGSRDGAADGLDLSRLSNVRTVGGKTIAACPACRESGGDEKGDHLFIDAAGRFGCVSNPGPAGHEHRQRVFALAGVVTKTATPRPPQHKPRAWETPEAAARACVPRGAIFEAVFEYPKNGKPFGAVGRYQFPNDKTFLQFHKNGAGWESGGPTGKWPLFRLAEIPPTGPVHIVEGEKKAVAAADVFKLPATTSPGGAKSAGKTDWTPLAGRDIYLWPDADEPGLAYAGTVAGILAKLEPSARVKICRLPYEMGTGKDIADFVFEANAFDEIKRLIEAAPPWEPPAVETKTAPAAGDQESRDLQAEFFQIGQTKGLSASERYQLMAAVTIEYLHRRGRFFYHADFRNYETAMFFDGTRKLLLRLAADEFQSWFAGYIGINRIDRPFAFVFSAIQDEALTGKTTGLLPEAYWAARPGAIYLSNGDGRAMKVTPGGVATVDNGADDVLFAAGRTLKPWRIVEPQDPFITCRLWREMTSAAPHGKDLLRLWIMSLPTNQRCKPPMTLSGGIGAGKTRTATGIFELYGLPPRVTAICETGEPDLWAGLDAGGLCCFDNADSRVRWLPDALAAAATDGTHEKRRLYTNSEIVQLKARAWAIITSANPTFAADAGLADRLLVVRLERRETDTAESTLADEIAANRDAGLSFIVHALSKALADQAPVPANLNRRHPDFAALVVRLGRAIGRESEAVQALSAAEADKSLFNLQNDDFGAGLLAMLENRETFTGTAPELLDALRAGDPAFTEGYWTPKRIAKRLAKLWPHVQAMFAARQTTGHGGGLTYAFTRHGDNGDIGGAVLGKVRVENKYNGFMGNDPLKVTIVTNEAAT